MAVRLLWHAFSRKSCVAAYIPAARGCARNRFLCATEKHIVWNSKPLQAALLHVRISDKDANLELKRTNKIKEQTKWQGNEEVEFKTEQQVPGVFQPLKEINKSESPSNLETLKTEQITKSSDDIVLGSDPDTFGNANIEEPIDQGDIEEEEYIAASGRRMKKLRTREYASVIKEHLNAKRLNEALNVLEVRMLKEDRVKPENYIYNLLISGCAKAGYTRKAFNLFTKMRQRGLKVTGGTYTSLFNACANAPTASDGLSKAQHLREIMLEKGYEPNVKNYNAMIKAFGRCGDVKTAYLLADEMKEHKIAFTPETYNFLLQACASDTELGFRHALLTWHKMIQSGLKPDYYTFHTMLRCVRDCGFGDLLTMEQVLKHILPEAEAEPQQLQLSDGCSSEKTQLIVQEEPSSSKIPANPFKDQSVEESTPVLTDLQIPNLLLPKPHLGSLVSLTEVTQPNERFLLLGGITGFLELMKSYKVTPDIETFTTMLEVIPPTNTAEKQLLTFIRKIGLKADVDFFNILIKKRSMRFDYESAKEVLSMVRTAGLQPDIVTYGVLALGCRTQEEAQELLLQMNAAGIRINIQILGAMLRQGCALKSFNYVNEIMQISLDCGIRPNGHFLTHLHNFYKQCARAIDARHPGTKSKAYQKGHAKFCDKYRLYYEEHGLTGLKLEDAIKKMKERPYAQYKESENGFTEPLKNEKLARKQKLRKYIKKIKIETLHDGNSEGVREEPKHIA